MEIVPVLWVPNGTWGSCQRCGFKRRLNDMSLEWTGLRVCDECHDPRPVQLSPPNVYNEGVPRFDAAPEPPDTFSSQDITPEDL